MYEYIYTKYTKNQCDMFVKCICNAYFFQKVPQQIDNIF